MDRHSEAYLIVIEKCIDGYSGYAPDVIGCGVAGDSLEETILLLREALEFHFRGLAEDDEEIPLPSGANAYNRAIEQSRNEEYFLTHITVQLPQTVEMLVV
jgi:predicted RNase H-like HicB family nuclease